MASDFCFASLRDSDADSAYALLEGRVAALLARGIRQYARPYPPRRDYGLRQARGQNYALYEMPSLALAAIVSLIPDSAPECWTAAFGGTAEVQGDGFAWLTSLFSNPEFAGRGVGYEALAGAERVARSMGAREVYLDCYLGSGFLREYYAGAGYEELGRKWVEYPENSFTAVLMRKII